MIYIFPETEKANERAREVLKNVKEEYQKPQMSEEQLESLRQTMQRAKAEGKSEEKRERNKRRWTRAAAVAAVFAAFMIILPNTSATVAYAMSELPVVGNLVKLVTFREYKYEDNRHMANIEVPELVLNGGVVNGKIVAEENGDSDNMENDIAVAAYGAEDSDSMVKKELEKTTREINDEIQQITDELVTHFEKYLHEDKSYMDVQVTSEVLATTQGYFTLKLLCYQGAGNGYQWNYYYTIDLSTGERMELKDLFVEGADFITPISENIKEQMLEQMKADEKVCYWVNDEIEALNFKSITEETSFYLNENGNVVIGFNEGDVAPMYMGAVEFEIPAEVLEDIRIK